MTVYIIEHAFEAKEDKRHASFSQSLGLSVLNKENSRKKKKKQKKKGINEPSKYKYLVVVCLSDCLLIAPYLHLHYNLRFVRERFEGA